MSDQPSTPSRRKSWFTIFLAIAILVPSLWGFSGKFAQFMATYLNEPDGAFALAPITNYLLASLGFFLLLCWAAANGMFRNIEGPKYTMLENERKLDQHARKKQ